MPTGVAPLLFADAATLARCFPAGTRLASGPPRDSRGAAARDARADRPVRATAGAFGGRAAGGLHRLGVSDPAREGSGIDRGPLPALLARRQAHAA